MRIWYEPVSSTCAETGAPATRLTAAARTTCVNVMCFMIRSRNLEGLRLPAAGGLQATGSNRASSKSRIARLRAPLGRVGLPLEVNGGYPRKLQVRRVDDVVGHDEITVTVRLRVHVPVLREHRAFAVRHAVLAQVARAQVRGDRLQ